MVLAALAIGGGLRLTAAGRPAGLRAYWYGDWEYYAIGVSWAESGVYRNFSQLPQTAYRMPLYPAFIAAVRRAVPGPRAVRYAQALLDTAAIYGVSLLADVAAGPFCGGLAALLYALAPVPIGQVPVLMLESFFTFLVAAAALALMHWTRKPSSVGRGACAGAVLGLTLLCRSTLFALPWLVVIGIIRGTKRPRECLPSAAVFLAACYLGLAPWIARNYAVFNAFIPFENGAAAFPIWGASLGLLPAITVPQMIDAKIESAAMSQGQSKEETSRSRFYFQSAMRAIARRPLRYAEESLLRLLLLWREQFFWLALAAIGAIADRRHWRSSAVLWLLAAYFNVHALMGVQVRYARPVFGPVCALAAIGLAACLRRLTRWPISVRRPDHALGQVRTSLAACLTMGGGLFLAVALLLVRESLGPPPADARNPESKRMNDEAVELSIQGRWRDAEEHFGKILEKDPAFVESLISRPFARERLGDDAGALEDYRRAALLLEFGGLRESPERLRRLEQF
jgi:4-amino-4-deoxy-L-arabinose transferase-like glycosyltransferase